MRRIIPMLIWLLILGGVIDYFLTVNYVTTEDKLKLKKAGDEYILGEKATNVGDRTEDFNNALSQYVELVAKYEPTRGNGKFYYNIANTYFQLGEYPWAILYYNKALKLMPRDDRAKGNLKFSLDKLGLAHQEKSGVFEKVFFFHIGLSTPEKLQLFFIFSLAAFILFSFYIWTSLKLWKRLSFVSLFITTLLLISAAYSFYFAAIDAILVKSSALYRGAGNLYAKVIEEPVIAGEKVEVLQSLADGKWLKVITKDGDIGYVSQEAAKIIEIN